MSRASAHSRVSAHAPHFKGSIVLTSIQTYGNYVPDSWVSARAAQNRDECLFISANGHLPGTLQYILLSFFWHDITNDIVHWCSGVYWLSSGVPVVSHGGKSDGCQRRSTVARRTEPARPAPYVSRSSRRAKQCAFYLAITVRNSIIVCVCVCSVVVRCICVSASSVYMCLTCVQYFIELLAVCTYTVTYS